MIRHMSILATLLVFLVAGCGADDGTGDGGSACTCTGSACCCGGLDTECEMGYLCAPDRHCKTVTNFSFTIVVTGKINVKPPKGSSWDTDGLPDPYVKVLRYGSQQCKSAAVKNTLEINASCKLSTVTEGTKLSIEAHDEDTAGDTMIFKGGWANGIPFSVFLTGAAPSQISGAVDHTSGVKVSFKRN